MTADFILQELLFLSNPEKAIVLQGFFKTAKGQYAENDVFLGIQVPLLRNIAKANKAIPLPEVQKLLLSEYHEARFVGLLFLVEQFKKADEKMRKTIFDFYLSNTQAINNWDLVDVTCRDIVGVYLLDKKEERKVLYRLADSKNLWEQRIAIISTWMFIKHKDYNDTLALSEKLLSHKHDLMHKAVGWMLREVGKKDKETLLIFLEKHCKTMPRTALRYSIEHFSSSERAYFMKREK